MDFLQFGMIPGYKFKLLYFFGLSNYFSKEKFEVKKF